MSKIRLTKTHRPQSNHYDYAYCIELPNKKGLQTYKIFEYDTPLMHPGNMKADERHPELSYFMREEAGVYARLFQGDILTLADEDGQLILSFNRLETKPKLVIYQEPAAPFIRLLSEKEAKRAGFSYENKSPTARKRCKIKQGLTFLLAVSALFGSCKYMEKHAHEIHESSWPAIEKIVRSINIFAHDITGAIQR